METLYAEYVALRISGMRPSAALDSLRERIEVLLPNEKLALVRAVRHYEDSAVETVTSSFRPTGNVAPSLFDDEAATGLTADDLARLAAESGDTTIKLPENLRRKVAPPPPPAAPAFVEPVAPPAADGEPHYTPCPNCGNPVLSSLLQCPTCYYVMPAAGPPVETPESFTEPLDEPPAAPAIQFGPRTTLVLTARDGRRLFSRPQDSRRETIVGRTDGKTFTADLDLSPLGAATLGVSRVHAALAFDSERGVMTLMDMNSMNGTFLNGLRLQPQDVHDLHPGDQVRFGRLTVRVGFENR